MALLDAVARLQPGVLNDEGSHQQDSFNPALDGLLDCPHYTRPEGLGRPAVPARCCRATMRRSSAGAATSACEITARHRPDLIAAARAAGA
jgi:tRNA (guanine37-N1)-methyltransferase